MHMQSKYVCDALGQKVRPLAARAPHSVVIARERQSVGVDESRSEFDIELAVPAVCVQEDELLQVEALTLRASALTSTDLSQGHRMRNAIKCVVAYNASIL
jgi:hypothetical protein